MRAFASETDDEASAELLVLEAEELTELEETLLDAGCALLTLLLVLEAEDETDDELTTDDELESEEEDDDVELDESISPEPDEELTLLDDEGIDPAGAICDTSTMVPPASVVSRAVPVSSTRWPM